MENVQQILQWREMEFGHVLVTHYRILMVLMMVLWFVLAGHLLVRRGVKHVIVIWYVLMNQAHAVDGTIG